MGLPSLKRMPSAPVLFARSDPARSTKCSFAHNMSSPNSSLFTPLGQEEIFFCSMVIVNIACERLETMQQVFKIVNLDEKINKEKCKEITTIALHMLSSFGGIRQLQVKTGQKRLFHQPFETMSSLKPTL